MAEATGEEEGDEAVGFPEGVGLGEWRCWMEKEKERRMVRVEEMEADGREGEMGGPTG